ncbi:hypothetical protein BDV30DRAFT_212893 [Aspergillus minisclerotigenes]|uniref:Uncharacterized protein n=1 Tax=Aspergillus minisclerotigenes TaxID=656917 RepID=A0A5N6J0Z3_9EURO|nr:hypothetical protein BDV30DRAFT_212893 [Aspergillus minisclerotigenes]
MSYLLPQPLRGPVWAAFSRLKMRESLLIVSSFLSLSLQFNRGRVHPYHRPFETLLRPLKISKPKMVNFLSL